LIGSVRDVNETDNFKHFTKTEKLMEFIFASKMKAMTYYEEMDLVSLGFKNGRIESYLVNIELD
jgi:hypothetical protein